MKSEHLLEHEEIKILSLPISREDEVNDNKINEKYIKGEVRIVTEQARYPLDSIKSMLESQKYNLNPEYQRRKRWSNNRKSRLIESFIMNVPIPPIFLYEVKYSEYEVMDGLQRLTAISEFYSNEYKLSGLDNWRELNGRAYKDLPEQVKRGIDRRYLSSIVLLAETAKSEQESEVLKRLVFERLNSGGEKLTPQETRNALSNGKFNQLCIKLSENEKFRTMWNLPKIEEIKSGIIRDTNGVKIEIDDISDDSGAARIQMYKKMLDVELVLRFFAYRQLEKQQSYSIDRFLDLYLDSANKFPDELIARMADLFNQTIDLVYDIFGDTAFIPPKTKILQKTPRKTVYDPMMQVFSRYLNMKSELKKHARNIKKRFQTSTSDILLPNSGSASLFDGRYNNRNHVDLRIEYFEKTINEILK